MKKLFLLLLSLMTLQGFAQSLKDVFAGDFLMGVSLSGRNVRIDAEQNLMLVKGAVPGGKNALVQVRMA